MIRFAEGSSAWKDFHDTVHQILAEKTSIKVAEIGGGANPLLSVDFVESHGLAYSILDISMEEMAKADPRYEKKVVDLQKPIVELPMQYDFIFSQMTMEHIQYPEQFYKNIFKLLNPGGQALFFFANITSLPSMLNKLMPESISERILLRLQPFRRGEKHGKFKAYYNWCFGPTRRSIGRFTRLGFSIKSYTGYFGHNYYSRIRPLQFLENKKTKLLLKFPNAYACTYSHVLLEKPATAAI